MSYIYSFILSLVRNPCFYSFHWNFLLSQVVLMKQTLQHQQAQAKQLQRQQAIVLMCRIYVGSINFEVWIFRFSCENSLWLILDCFHILDYSKIFSFHLWCIILSSSIFLVLCVCYASLFWIRQNIIFNIYWQNSVSLAYRIYTILRVKQYKKNILEFSLPRI